MSKRVAAGIAILFLLVAACDLESAGLDNAEKGARKELRKTRDARQDDRKKKRNASERRDRQSEQKKATSVTKDDPADDCTPGYGQCLPPAADYDCAGGSGNGPEYVRGPITVTGDDPYDLDSDGDGLACES